MTARVPTQSQRPDLHKGGAIVVREPLYKRPLDLLVLAVAHIVLAPLFILLWTVIPLVVWLGDRGPVFYKQQRAGKHGCVFTIRKFRTMIPNADRVGPVWTSEGDARITWIGRVLRKTALDELPETLSIWKGDMSLVGPRALAVSEQRMLEERIPGFDERLKVRPGLTGMAQVYNKADDPHLKLKYDREYIARMGLWLDIKLLFLSVYYTVLSRWDSRSSKGGAASPREQ